MEKHKGHSSQDKAVALKYDAGIDAAPKVIAKGRDYLAKKIIEIARKSNVPVYADPQLAGLLYEVSLDKVIPESLYHLVAEVLAWVYSVDANFKKSMEVKK
jgi:FlhB-like protein